MPTYRTLIGFAAAVALVGCASVKDPFYQFKYPTESYTIGGKVMILATKKCRSDRKDCVVDVDPTPDPAANWAPDVIDVNLKAPNSGNIIHWRINDIDNWTFADPGIVFKNAAGQEQFSCVHTRFVIQCKNGRKAGPYEYKIRVLKNGEGPPIETDPWVVNQ
jgi:hypothetical protein